jgi:hypothetical protein
MTIQFIDHINLNQSEIRQAVLENLATAPTSPSPKKGQQYFDTTSNKTGTYNGSSWDYAGSGAVTSINVNSPLTTTGGNTPTLGINPASGATAGSMSITDYTKLAASTALNTVSTIVQRDSSGNFAAGTITANLTGTASNASNLGSQTPAFYQARANHTGTQTASTISDFAANVVSTRLDQFASPTSAVGFGSQRITAVADPTNPSDAATKNYVDAAITTGNNKGTARAAAWTNVTLATPGASIDSVTLVSGDIVLLAGQTTASQNGLYVWTGASTALTRTTAADTSAEVKSGLFVYISEGTTCGSNGYTLTTPNPIVLDTTALTFTQTSGAGQIVAGTGITKTGNTLNVNTTANAGIVVNADDIGVDYTIVTRKYTQLIGDGTSNSITVTHTCNNDNPTVVLKQALTPFNVMQCGVLAISTTQVTLTFATAPTSNQYRVTIQG